MIKKIVLKDIASYDKTGVIIDGLTKLNYFFGNNGSGKSTIAKYIQSIDNENSKELYPSCSQDGFNPDQDEILVFDQTFIDDNFKNNDNLKGVFSLNEANAVVDKKIKSNEKEIADNENKKMEIEAEVENLTNEKAALYDRTCDYCFNKRDIFKSFSKIKLEYSGNKKSNLSNIEKLIKNTIPQHQLDDIRKLYKQLYEEQLTFIDVHINEQLFEYLINSQNELAELLKKIIVGKEDVKLSKMIEEFGLKQWVAQGKTFLEKTKNICPFCQKATIDNEFISQLNSIFDESFKQQVSKIESLKANYENTFSKVEQNIKDVSSKYNEQNISSNLQIKLKEYFNNNIKIINEKIQSPNEKKEFSPVPPSFHEDIKSINVSIKQNNDIVNSTDEQKELLKKQMWEYITLECKNEIENYYQAREQLDSSIDDNSDKISEIDNTISELYNENTELRIKTVNTKKAVDNINQILKNSGFAGFYILEKDTINNISRYYLARTNEIMQYNIFASLSEGEKNFIAFLYFYQLCLGTTNLLANSSKKKIIVIDDPVSSMDSQVLFIVSTLVNRLITYQKNAKKEFSNENIEQVFILTHNYYFYKEVAIKQHPICKAQKHYLVTKNGGNTTSINEYDYKGFDDYSLMWQTLKEIKETSVDDTDHSQNITVANLFRRILETYAHFIGIGNNVWATIFNDNDKDSADYYLKYAFISMINDESHKVSPLDSMYFQRISSEKISKLFEIFKSIFDVIGKEHYSMMMKENQI